MPEVFPGILGFFGQKRPDVRDFNCIKQNGQTFFGGCPEKVWAKVTGEFHGPKVFFSGIFWLEDFFRYSILKWFPSINAESMVKLELLAVVWAVHQYRSIQYRSIPNSVLIVSRKLVSRKTISVSSIEKNVSTLWLSRYKNHAHEIC